MKVTSIGGISVGGDDVLVQVGVEQPRGAWVAGAGFEQGLADAHDGVAAHLAFGGLAVQLPETAPPGRAGGHKEPPW